MHWKRDIIIVFNQFYHKNRQKAIIGAKRKPAGAGGISEIEASPRWNLRTWVINQRRSRCISSIPQELYIIKAKLCISSSRRREYTALPWWYALHLCGDDIQPYGLMIYQASVPSGLDTKPPHLFTKWGGFDVCVRPKVYLFEVSRGKITPEQLCFAYFFSYNQD